MPQFLGHELVPCLSPQGNRDSCARIPDKEHSNLFPNGAVLDVGLPVAVGRGREIEKTTVGRRMGDLSVGRKKTTPQYGRASNSVSR